ncbi:MAG: hypothetical protein WBA17_01440 [Saprospiraceae bacterium]
MSNKYFIKLRLSRLLRFLPFSVWSRLDAPANKVARNPERLVVEIVK